MLTHPEIPTKEKENDYMEFCLQGHDETDAGSTLRSWESRIENERGNADIRIDGDLKSLSADIISRACFGSSYSKGEEIFS